MSEEMEKPLIAGPTEVVPFEAADSVEDLSSMNSEKNAQNDAAAPSQAEAQALQRKVSAAPSMDDSGITVTEFDDDEIVDLTKFDRAPEAIPDAIASGAASIPNAASIPPVSDAKQASAEKPPTKPDSAQTAPEEEDAELIELPSAPAADSAAADKDTVQDNPAAPAANDEAEETAAPACPPATAPAAEPATAPAAAQGTVPVPAPAAAPVAAPATAAAPAGAPAASAEGAAQAPAQAPAGAPSADGEKNPASANCVLM